MFPFFIPSIVEGFPFFHMLNKTDILSFNLFAHPPTGMNYLIIYIVIFPLIVNFPLISQASYVFINNMGFPCRELPFLNFCLFFYFFLIDL